MSTLTKIGSVISSINIYFTVIRKWLNVEEVFKVEKYEDSRFKFISKAKIICIRYTFGC